jgi:hypothetical protein
MWCDGHVVGSGGMCARVLRAGQGRAGGMTIKFLIGTPPPWGWLVGAYMCAVGNTSTLGPEHAEPLMQTEALWLPTSQAAAAISALRRVGGQQSMLLCSRAMGVGAGSTE